MIAGDGVERIIDARYTRDHLHGFVGGEERAREVELATGPAQHLCDVASVEPEGHRTARRGGGDAVACHHLALGSELHAHVRAVGGAGHAHEVIRAALLQHRRPHRDQRSALQLRDPGQVDLLERSARDPRGPRHTVRARHRDVRVGGADVRDRDREVEHVLHEVRGDGRPVVAADVGLGGERLLAGIGVAHRDPCAAVAAFERAGRELLPHAMMTTAAIPAAATVLMLVWFMDHSS